MSGSSMEEVQLRDKVRYLEAYIYELKKLLREAIESPFLDNDADVGDWGDRVRKALR